MANSQVEFDRQGLDPNMRHEKFVYFMDRLLPMDSKLKTELLKFDFENMNVSYPAYKTAFNAEKEFLASEKNVFLTQAAKDVVSIYHLGKGFVDSSDKKVAKVAEKAIKLTEKYVKGEQNIERANLDDAYAHGLEVSDKMSALGADKVALIHAEDALSSLTSSLKSFLDTSGERNDFLTSLRGKTTETKAAAVKDLRVLFGSIPGVQHKTGYKENIFVTAINKLITDTKDKFGKGGSSSGK